MKNYNEFITELNKVEALMKAGKLAAKTIRRISPGESYKMLGGVKVTGDLKKVKVPFRNIIRHRDSPISNIITPRRKIENFQKVTGGQNFNFNPFKGTVLDTAIRQKKFRGQGKKQGAYMDRAIKGMPQKPKNQPTVQRDYSNMGDSNRMLDVPATQKAGMEMNPKPDWHYTLEKGRPGYRIPATPVYNKNTRGQLTTKSVKYKKVPDSIENKIRDAIRQRRKK